MPIFKGKLGKIIIAIPTALLVLGLATGAWYYFLSLGETGETEDTITEEINTATNEILEEIDSEAVEKATYDEAFSKLQAEGNRAIDTLLSEIKADYTELQEKGKPSAIELAKLASSYIKRADLVESNLDASLITILNRMEEDMTAAGIDAAEIKEYKNYYNTEYEKVKKARRDQMTSIAASYL